MYEVICILYHAHWLMLDMPPEVKCVGAIAF